MNKKNFGLIVVLIASLASLFISIYLIVDLSQIDSASPNNAVVDVGNNNNNSMGAQPNNNTVSPGIENTTLNTITDNNVQPETPNQPDQPVTPEQPGPSGTGDVSAMAPADILKMLGDAVNKTKAYTNTLSVKHVETFDANVTECTGGSTVASIANSVVSSIAAPTDEVLTFNGGTATDSEGETVTILLPQKGNFRLTMDGIKTITATKNGDETVINVTLVEETVDHTVFPTFNAAGVGYLDLSTLDLGVLSIDTANMYYPGSTIEARIRPDGYVSYAAYTIPMDVSVTTKGLIRANLAFEGMQTETWQFNW